jgi:methylthioxylose transferase
MVAVATIGTAAALPYATGLDVHVGTFPPLLADWRPRVGIGTAPALAIAAVVCTRTVGRAAERLTWGRLLAVGWVLGVAWMVSLALVDGPRGISRVLDQGTEYLQTARQVADVPETLRHFVERIPFERADHWAEHVAGHPPGALLSFVALARVGLGSGLAAGLAVIAVAATTPLGVAVAARAVGAEKPVRIAAPFLVLGPAAIWQAVSADAMFAAVAAWGLAALALAAARPAWDRRAVAWSALAGLLLGWCLMLSYGLVLNVFLAVAVLLAAGSLRPLPIVAASAAVPVAVFAAYGFRWWDAFPVLGERYWSGIAAERPASYWIWANLAVLALSAGPLVYAAIARAAPQLVRAARRPAYDPVATLALAALVTVTAADVSLMSKSEVERIWLPFVPWLLLTTAYLHPRWRRRALAGQAVTALAIQHLLWSPW